MGSLDNYLDIPQQQRQAVAFVVSDADQTVDVFRRPRQQGVAGLTERTAEERFLRRTRVRITNAVTRARSMLKGATRQADNPTALTNDTDVRVDDLWRYLDVDERERWFRVDIVRRVPGGCSVVLDEVKR